MDINFVSSWNVDVGLACVLILGFQVSECEVN